MVQLKDWFIQHKFSCVLAVALVLGGICYFYFHDPSPPVNPSLNEAELSNSANKEVTSEKPASAEKSQEPIMVDVKGEIKHPGVYQSSMEERVIDVIHRAGGLTNKADESKVNFAQHVQDEMVIYIPAKGEAEAASADISRGGTSASSGNSENAKIDLNQADSSALQTLPGVGPAKAAAIIDYREKSGPFKTIEDLKNISGIGDKTFEKLKDLIIVH